MSADTYTGSTNYVTHEVDGREYEFHPVTLGAMFKLRKVAKPLAGALSVLFTQRGGDHTVVQRRFDGDSNSGGGEEVITEAITPKLAELRVKQQAKGFEDLIEAVTDPKNAEVVGSLICNSLRGSKPPEASSPGKWLEDMEIGTVFQYLQGLAKANKQVLGPLADRVRDINPDVVPNATAG